MRNTMRLVPLFATLLFATPACAQTHSMMEHHPEEAGTRVRLVETAQRTVRQDRLRAILRAEVTGPDARRVQAEINRRMTAAVERAKAAPTIKVETGSYSLYEERPPNGNTTWRGQQSLALIGTEFNDVLQLAGELQQAGLVFSGMQFELRPETARAYEDELTAEALKRLRERADKIATGMDMKVIGIREISVGNVLGDTPRPPVRMRMEAMAAPAAPPVAEAGDQIIQISVQAEIAVGPK
jgi:predicted secreted protein